MTTQAPLLVIAAGGTGGHMFPAQALAEEMLARGWRVKLSTDARGARYAGGFPEEVPVEQIAGKDGKSCGMVLRFRFVFFKRTNPNFRRCPGDYSFNARFWDSTSIPNALPTAK